MRPDVSFSKLGTRPAAFYLSRREPRGSHGCTRLLCNRLRESSSAIPRRAQAPAGDAAATALRPVGFGADEGCCPYPALLRGLPLLQEYFAFPEKFFFFDLQRVGTRMRPAGIQRRRDDLPVRGFEATSGGSAGERGYRATFRLGCTPVINLFQQPAEPILLDQKRTSTRSCPTCDGERHGDVLDRRGERRQRQTQEEVRVPTVLFVPARRLPAREGLLAGPGGRRTASGRRGRISTSRSGPVDAPRCARKRHAHGPTGDLHQPRPAGAAAIRQPGRATSTGNNGPIKRIVASKPTEPMRPPMGKGAVAADLAPVAQLPLAGRRGPGGAAGDSEALQLHRVDALTAKMIEGIVRVQSRRISRAWYRTMESRSRGAPRVEIELDEEQFVGGGVYLFASVLERFLGLYASPEQLQPTARPHQAKKGGHCRNGHREPDGQNLLLIRCRWRRTAAGTRAPFEFFQAVGCCKRLCRESAGGFARPGAGGRALQRASVAAVSGQPDPEDRRPEDGQRR
jgi:type VI secretion system protein ImpG